MKKEIDGVVFREDSRGALVPETSIKPQDILKDDLVEESAAKIIALEEEMRKVKKDILEAIRAYIDLIGEKYGVKLGGQKGNVQLVSLDGKTKILISISERIALNENVIAAKELIDQYLEDAIKGSSADIKQLVTSAFRVKQGSLDARSILRLRQLNIEDERWKKAMDIIADSIVIQSSESYLRLYRKNAAGAMEYIPLDFAVIA